MFPFFLLMFLLPFLFLGFSKLSKMSSFTFTRKNPTQCFPRLTLVPVSLDDQHLSGSGSPLEPGSSWGRLVSAPPPPPPPRLPSQLLLPGCVWLTRWPPLPGRPPGLRVERTPAEGTEVRRGFCLNAHPGNLGRSWHPAALPYDLFCAWRITCHASHPHPTTHLSLLLIPSLSFSLPSFPRKL